MRKLVMVLVAAALVAVAAVAAGLHFWEQPVTLQVAAPQISEDLRLLQAAAHVFSQQHKHLRLKIQPVADSAAAAALIDSGGADLAVMRADIALSSNAQELAILHRNPVLLAAPGGSKLRRVADLRGKRIGVVHEIASMEPNARLLQTILAQYEIPRENVTLVSLGPDEVGAALASGRIDAVFSATPPAPGHESEVVAAVAAASKKPPVFIPIDEAKAIAKHAPSLEPMEIVQGAFGGDPPRPAAAFDSLSVSVLLMAKSSLSDDLAAEVTRLIFSHKGAIAVSAPLASAIEAPSTDRGGIIPLHQGAIDYLDGNEKTFFEKYNDAFYIGAMLVSLVASGAAALLSRFSDYTHHRAEEIAEALLGVIRAAPQAATQADVDALEREVDEVVTKLIGDKGVRRLDATGLHLVTLALDQARRAVEERRLILSRGDTVVEFPTPRSVLPPPA
jgi:TRAP transporter TAXI family solute receptor